MSKTYFRVLSIAGSDSGGGAGIQADIKTISACGCYASTAITAITAQNTLGVFDVVSIPISSIQKQIECVLDDIGTDAIKIGMLHSSEVIQSVKESLCKYSLKNIVIDPVMVATSGDKLLADDAVNTLLNELLPLARVITPNIPEAEVLLNCKIADQKELPDLAIKLSGMCKTSVLLKAGHLNDEILTDIFYNFETNEIIELTSQRVFTNNTHGTGCSLSSALAAFLARNYSLNESVQLAKNYITNAIKSGAEYSIGKGNGPVNHFYNYSSFS